jgi:hypothetical protein
MLVKGYLHLNINKHTKELNVGAIHDLPPAKIRALSLSAIA